MATPSGNRPPSSSTPKNASIATPTAMLPSPRPPTSAPMARTISHKSPAMKTPASAQGHSHNVSTSSHPASTPLAAPVFGDDSFNFNSPAAVIMSSLGSHGLTPLPSGPEGLGISAEISAVSGGHRSMLATRNPEEDKARRLREVVKLLRSRVSGRGISREGVERLAQLAGFTHMWQGDTLAIAGTCVDLEITFEAIEKDKAKDVILKIFTTEAEEHQKEASEVLKADLDQLSDSHESEPWRSLVSFASNLEHLGKMDSLSQGINCFEAVDGLYSTFRRIWEGEKERMGQRRLSDRLRQGALGRPALNQRKLGLRIDYWAETRQYARGASVAEDSATELEAPVYARELRGDRTGIWTANIDCEAGYPSIRVAKDWTADSVFDDAKAEVDGAAKEPRARGVAWVEPLPSLVRPAEIANHGKAMEIDEAEIKIPQQPQVRFAVQLEPTVLVPLPVVSSVLNIKRRSVVVDESKFTTFDQALRDMGHSTSLPDHGEIRSIKQRWARAVTSFDKAGMAKSRLQSFGLYSIPQVWVYPVQSIAFDHPKHLADLLPSLRQYILLWTLLRSIVPKESNKNRQTIGQAIKSTDLIGVEDPKPSPTRGITQKSNKNSQQAKLRSLLQPTAARSTDSSSLSPDDDEVTTPLAIDVSFSLTSSTPSTPKLDVIWPLPKSLNSSTGGQKATFATISIEIGLNGDIVVPATAGIPFAKSQRGRNAIAEVLGMSEDLGLLVEWVVTKLDESRG